MKLDIFDFGQFGENTYVVHEAGHVLFIDPGRYAKKLIQAVDKKEIVDGILLTHGHEDHTGAVDDLVDTYQCKVYMNLEDYPLVDPNHARHGYDSPIYSPIESLMNQSQIGSFKIKVYHTPGHTSGSCCIQYKNLLFTGDTLFASDIGRTDLYLGNEAQMLDSLRKLKELPNDLKIYPGHGQSSTMKDEKEKNIYLITLR